jgi:hypothetical protein
MIVESRYILWLPIIYFHMVNQYLLFRDLVSVASPSPQRVRLGSPRNAWSGAIIFAFPVAARTLSECIGQTLECAKKFQAWWNGQVTHDISSISEINMWIESSNEYREYFIVDWQSRVRELMSGSRSEFLVHYTFMQFTYLEKMADKRHLTTSKLLNHGFLRKNPENKVHNQGNIEMWPWHYNMNSTDHWQRRNERKKLFLDLISANCYEVLSPNVITKVGLILILE